MSARMMTLSGRTMVAVGWGAVARIAQELFQFALSILLMRLLAPETFGLMSMVLVFSGFAATLTDMGFSAAVVQRKRLEEEHRSSAFWLTLAIGVVLAIAMAVSAPIVATFYREPMLRSMTFWVGLTFVMVAPGIVPRALLQRAMRFDQLAKIDMATLVVSGSAAAAVALAGAGVWSLVIQALVRAAVGSGLALWAAGWWPRRGWTYGAAADLMRYGAGLTGFTLVNYWARSADKLLIGRVIGPVGLGLYVRAYSLMLLPLTHVVGVLGPAFFVALSSIQDDRARVRAAYLRAMRAVTFVAFPLMLGLFVVARPFVLGLAGPHWEGVIPLVEILALVGIIQTVCNPTGWIYTSQGRTDVMFWWGVAGSGTLIAAIAIGSFVGGDVRSVAWAYLIGNVLILYPCIAIPGRLIGLRVSEIFTSVAGNGACAVAMAGFVWIVRQQLPGDWHPLLELSILVPLGVLTFGALAVAMKLEALGEIANAARHAIAGRTYTAA